MPSESRWYKLVQKYWASQVKLSQLHNFISPYSDYSVIITDGDGEQSYGAVSAVNSIQSTHIVVITAL